MQFKNITPHIILAYSYITRVSICTTRYHLRFTTLSMQHQLAHIHLWTKCTANHLWSKRAEGERQHTKTTQATRGRQSLIRSGRKEGQCYNPKISCPPQVHTPHNTPIVYLISHKAWPWLTYLHKGATKTSNNYTCYKLSQSMHTNKSTNPALRQTPSQTNALHPSYPTTPPCHEEDIQETSTQHPNNTSNIIGKFSLSHATKNVPPCHNTP